MKKTTTVQHLAAARNHLLIIAAEVAAYSWSAEFSKSQLVGAWISADPWRLTAKDFWNLSFKQMCDFGFGRWDEQSQLRLIPLWVYHYIADGTVLTCIDGTTKIKGTDEIDLDVRCSCIAYGFDWGTY